MEQNLTMQRTVGAKPPVRLNHWHEALLNLMITNPEMTLGEMALRLNKTQSWVSIVKNSDLFQAEYRARCQMMGEIAVHGTVERLQGLAEKALEKMEDKLNLPAAMIPETFLLGSMNSVLDRLGFTAKGQGAATVNNVQNNFIVDSEMLERSRERAAQVHDRPLGLKDAGDVVDLVLETE